MQKFSRKYSNREYAPGLALYGVDGKDGVSGESGRSLFVCQYNIDDNEEAGKFGNAINQGLDMTSNDNSVIGRPYMNGDVFIFSTGYLYRIDDYDAISTLGGQLTAAKFQEYMSVVGVIKITEASEIFSENTNRLVLDTEHYKGFIVNMSSVSETDLGTINSPLTVISDNETRDGRIYFMGLKSIYAGSSDARLSIYYDTDNNAYVIDSDKDVLIDADVRISSQGDDNVYDDFSKPLLTGSDMSLTSFGGLCNHLSWKMGTATYTNKVDDEVTTTTELYYDNTSTSVLTDTQLEDRGGIWRVPSAGTSPGYTIRQFDLRQHGATTDYVTICAIRKYDSAYDNFETYSSNVSGLKFNLIYGFTFGLVSYNSAPAGGIEYVRQPITTDTVPETWSKRWWDEVKHAEPTGEKYWAAQMFCTPLDEKVFIPQERTHLIISAPSDVYVMVYADGSVLYPVNSELETSKVNFITNSNAETVSKMTQRTGYDAFAFLSPRYKRTLKIKNNATAQDNGYDELKKTSIHISGISKKGLKAGQRVMEYYVRNTDDDYPAPATTKSVDLYGDYPDGSIDWYVSVIGDNYTEFFIKEE